MKDKISVIIPCYNVAKYIDRCFDSLLNQSYGFANLEIIFVDDLSSDDTYKILEDYKDKYDNIKLIKVASKKGAGGARNIGIDNCSGKYLSFVDADDWINPNMFTLLHEQMLKADFDIVQCYSFMFSDEPIIYDNKDCSIVSFDLEETELRNKVLADLTKDLNLTVWSKLYSTKFIKDNNLRFLEDCYFEDNHFTLMCMVLAKKYCKIRALLYGYYNNLDGTITSRLDPKRIHDLQLVVEYALNDIKQRGIDTSKYQDALDNFVFYKLYVETTTNLEIAFAAEKQHYRQLILDKIPNILDNPYLKTYSNPNIIKKIDKLKSL